MPRRGWTIAALVLGMAGVAYRLQDLGDHGFWTDEAWVALSTRVTGLSQWWLALSVTPIGWAACLRALAAVPGPPETVLRCLPLAASVATLWVAWRLGARLAGHPAGGVAAVAVVATDPAAIAYAKVVKQYSTEAFLALLAVDLAVATPPALGPLAVVLVAGSLFSNAQPLVAGPIVATLVVAAWRVGDRARLRTTLATGALALAGAGAIAVACLLPHRTPGLAGYYATGYLPTDSLGALATNVATWTASIGMIALGPVAAPIALVAVVLHARRSAGTRRAAVVLALVVSELLVLSAVRLVPISEGRILQFVLVLVEVVGAAAIVGAVATADRPWLRAVALALATVAAVDVGARRDWWTMGRATQIEDLGPLVRDMERRRLPADRVLVYQPSVYVVAYYLAAPPVLDPLPATTVGWAPRFPAGFAVVTAASIGAEMAAAQAARARLWFLGSRIRFEDADVLVAALRRGTVLAHERRPNAELLLVGPTEP